MGKPWFGPRKYGIGITPISIEGWLVGLVYVIALVLTATMVVMAEAPPWAGTVAVGAETFALLAVAVAKYDGSAVRWRWGSRD